MMDTKILVVDDDPNISDLLKIYFENEGYEVKTVGDGAEGINYFKMYEPDLVLLDIMLPKKDGWQVCREIREISSKPIIMVTAKGEVFDKVLGLELGADDFVVKPFDMKELSARIKASLPWRHLPPCFPPPQPPWHTAFKERQPSHGVRNGRCRAAKRSHRPAFPPPICAFHRRSGTVLQNKIKKEGNRHEDHSHRR